MILTLIFRSNRDGQSNFVAPSPAAAVRFVVAASLLLATVIPQQAQSLTVDGSNDDVITRAPRIRVHHVVPCAVRSENMITSNIAGSSADDSAAAAAADGEKLRDGGSDCVIKARHAGMLRPHPTFVRLHRAAVLKAQEAARRRSKDDPRALPPHRRRVTGAEDLNLRSAEDFSSLVLLRAMADGNSGESGESEDSGDSDSTPAAELSDDGASASHAAVSSKSSNRPTTTSKNATEASNTPLPTTTMNKNSTIGTEIKNQSARETASGVGRLKDDSSEEETKTKKASQSDSNNREEGSRSGKGKRGDERVKPSKLVGKWRGGKGDNDVREIIL
ncbi:hypothetical protein CLOP_g21348 [Closterium sp. NIES-67]|nr:hypothetical protein CLOP_g21348 [Closterium sp. NIES-67]